MNITMPRAISTEFIYVCMGFGNKEPNQDSIELVKKCSELVLSEAVPHAIYKNFSMGVTELDGEVYIVNEKNILEGKDIAKHLKGSSQCILMAITLGPQMDKLIRRAQVTDMTKAIALDACASALIEDLCDQINKQIIDEYEEQGMGLTKRYGPGYGDLPLEAHSVFSKLLDMEKKIGLTQSSEHLLLPRKSITSVMGILPLDEIENARRKEKSDEDTVIACETCERKNQCQFRLNGGYCGKK